MRIHELFEIQVCQVLKSGNGSDNGAAHVEHAYFATIMGKENGPIVEIRSMTYEDLLAQIMSALPSLRRTLEV